MPGFHVPPRDFLGPFSASPVTLEHCGLGLEGCIVKLPLDGSLAELPAAVDSHGMALEYCAIMLLWETQSEELFAKLLKALFGLRWILFLRNWVPVQVIIRYERGVSP